MEVSSSLCLDTWRVAKSISAFLSLRTLIDGAVPELAALHHRVVAVFSSSCVKSSHFTDICLYSSGVVPLLSKRECTIIVTSI